MDKSFDFLELLKKHEKKHKIKPAQFMSVAGGVQRRLENNIKLRKSSRLSFFDRIRDIPKEETVLPQPVDQRRQKLEKWRAENEKRKKAAALSKKKPFVVGVVHNSLHFKPPPPPPQFQKTAPSTSGRVTRSQSASATNKKPNVEIKIPVKKNKKVTQSFAPKNAKFQPPLLKNISDIPILRKQKDKSSNQTLMFDPVVPKDVCQDKLKTKELKSTSAKCINHALDSGKSKKKQTTENRPTRHTAYTRGNSKSNSLINSSTSSSDVNLSPKIKKVKTPRKSFPKQRSVTPKSLSVPKSESSSEELLRSPSSPIDLVGTPEQSSLEETRISPHVTMSRGKDNARREMKKKMDDGLLDEDTSDIDSVAHFRRQLESEISRMTAMCEEWDRVLSHNPEMPENVQELILTAVGQSRLLMTQKMQQFASLVERCAKPEPGTSLVTPADLLGFWDMLFMQVENVDMRFKKLEEIRSRGWVEEVVEVKQKKKASKACAPVAAVKKPAGNSRLKEMIAAARQAQKAASSGPEADPPKPLPQALPLPESKTFSGGFFCVRSPVRSPAAATPARPALLRSVLSSEASKSSSKSSASYAMLRASLMSKHVDIDGIAPLLQTPKPAPINFHATPARSILKSAKKSEHKNRKSAKKSIKTVLFNDSDNDIESNLNNSKDNININSSLARTENIDDKQTDSGVSSMETDKENSRKSSRLTRQEAVDQSPVQSPVQTRNRRKSLTTSKVEKVEESKPSTRKKKVLQEVNEDAITPRRSTRRRKSVANN